MKELACAGGWRDPVAGPGPPLPSATGPFSSLFRASFRDVVDEFAVPSTELAGDWDGPCNGEDVPEEDSFFFDFESLFRDS